jgi:hypothetical protein
MGWGAYLDVIDFISTFTWLLFAISEMMFYQIQP